MFVKEIKYKYVNNLYIVKTFFFLGYFDYLEKILVAEDLNFFLFYVLYPFLHTQKWTNKWYFLFFK